MGKCKWNPAWQTSFPWARPVAGDPHRVFCSYCTSTFKCSKGTSELKDHGDGRGHQAREGNATSEIARGIRTTKQGSIEGALRNSEAAAVQQRRIKDETLKAEASLATLVATHNLPLGTMDCLAELLPKIFHDSAIAKQMSLHRTKATYILRLGVAKAARDKILCQMRIWPYSLNIDESVKGGNSQLEIVVIYRSKQDLIERAHLGAVDMKVSLTGANISKAMFNSLDEMGVPYKNLLVSNRTDGCSVMLGVNNGCHVNCKAVVRETLESKLTVFYTFILLQVPQLPDLGGCSCHDACNCLKKGAAVLFPGLMDMWKALYPCLEKASIKKSLHYKFLASEAGLALRHSPKFLVVRFRYCIVLATFCEENDRAIYLYFMEIAETYRTTLKLPSENETTVISTYLGDYIRVRLCHMFLIAAGDSFLKFIEFFETRGVRIHLIFPKTVFLLCQHLSFFLKSGDRDKLPVKRLLEVDFKADEMQLSKKDVFIGASARSFIKKIGFTPQSPELGEFFQGVVQYYHESTAALLKYSKNTLSNPFIAALTVLDPANKEKDEMATQRKNWDILATQLSHIVDEEAKTALLTEELVAYQRVETAGQLCEVDEWWAMVAEMTLGGEKQFPIITKLALACATMAASSSEVEREFSSISDVFANPKVNNLSQELLDSKQVVKSAERAEARNCARCKEREKERKEKQLRGEKLPKERCKHCHCSLLKVDDNLLKKRRKGWRRTKSKTRRTLKRA